MPNDNLSPGTATGASQSTATAAASEQSPASASAAGAGADRLPTTQRAPRLPSRSTAVSPWDDEDDDGKW